MSGRFIFIGRSPIHCNRTPVTGQENSLFLYAGHSVDFILFLILLRLHGYQAFTGLCSAAQTMLNSELSAAGIAEVTLTPENYTETLSDLKETLNGMLSENCFSKIFSKAVEAKVTAAIGKIDDLQTQLDNYQTFYDGVAAYTNGVDSAASGAATLHNGVDTLHRNTAEHCCLERCRWPAEQQDR